MKSPAWWHVIGIAVAGFSGITSTATAASTIDVASTQIEFVAPDDIGVGEGAGFSHRFTNVIPGSAKAIDARITIVAINNLESDANDTASATTPDNKVVKLDDWSSNTTRNKNIGLELDIFGVSGDPALGSVTLRVEFLESGSLVPVVLGNMSMYVTDIDSNQFFQVSGITAYRTTSSTKLTVKSNSADSTIPLGSYRFVAPATSSSSTDPDAADFWAEVSVAEASYLDFTIGAAEGGSATFDLVFSKANWTGATAVDTAPPAPSYTVSYDGNASTAGTAPASQTSSTYITIPANTGALERPGFEFTGWNSAADGSGLVVDPATQFRPTSNITLYAQWKAVASTSTSTTTSAVVADVEATDAGEDTPLSNTGFSTTAVLVVAALSIMVGLRMRRSVVR